MPTAMQLLHDPLWYPRWRVLLLVLAVISAYFAFAPADLVIGGSVNDKVGHMAAFAAMGVAAALSGPATWRYASAAWAGLLAYGAFIEVVQSQLPTRQAELADLATDGAGALVGLMLVGVLRRCCGRLPPAVQSAADR